MTPPAPAPTFSRPFLVDDLRDTPERVTITATPAECAALAAENGLPSIAALSARLTLTREGKTMIRVAGALKAGITQICVVTLDPFDTAIDETFEIHFASEAEVREAEARLADASEDDEEDGEGERAEPPDPIINNQIDLGRVTAEFFVLGLDPYPRKPGAEFKPPNPPDPAEDSPFAALAKLKGELPPGT